LRPPDVATAGQALRCNYETIMHEHTNSAFHNLTSSAPIVPYIPNFSGIEQSLAKLLRYAVFEWTGSSAII